MNTIDLKRKKGDFGFEATDANGHLIKLDTSDETGGINFGFRPMQSLLAGLGGCSGIDIVSILKKQRQPIEGFHMEINGDRESGVEPSLWKFIELEFIIYGDVEEGKAQRAVELSVNKYCSVAATLMKSGTEIKWSVKVERNQ